MGGFGDAVARLLRDNDIDTPVRTFGLEQQFLDHGERAQVLEAQGLTLAAPGASGHRDRREARAGACRRGPAGLSSRTAGQAGESIRPE